MRERIDNAVWPDAARAADDPAVLPGRKLDPDLVGVDGALGEGMAHIQGSHHHFHEVLAAFLERGRLGPDRAQEPAVDRSSLAEREDVNSHLLILEKRRLPLGRLLVSVKHGQARIGAQEQMVMDLPCSLAVKIPGPEIRRGQQVHVALGAV
jgi:hypothetical protein